MRIPLPPHGPWLPGRYAAIDIGTVTCRLLVADLLPDGTLNELCRDMEICNLGVGVDETGLLNAQAIERVGRAVDRFMAEVRRLSGEGAPLPLAVVATSASRDAANADEFAARLAQAGVRPLVISGMQEAALSFSGASCTFAGQEVAVVDVGGGSTEVVAGTAGDAPRFARSFDVGCRRMTERFLRDDPVAAAQLEEARAWVMGEMAPFIGKLRGEGCFTGPLLAVAGTATSCVTMRDALEAYDPNAVHGAFVSRADVDCLVSRLSCLPLAQRRQVPGLEPRRAEVITAGLLILQAVLELSGAPGFTVSETDILHGVILALALPAGASPLEGLSA